MAKKIEIVVSYSGDFESMEYAIVIVNGISRKLIKQLSEYKITELNPMIDEVEQVREYVETCATTLARELGVDEVVWNNSNVL